MSWLSYLKNKTRYIQSSRDFHRNYVWAYIHFSLGESRNNAMICVYDKWGTVVFSFLILKLTIFLLLSVWSTECHRKLTSSFVSTDLNISLNIYNTTISENIKHIKEKHSPSPCVAESLKHQLFDILFHFSSFLCKDETEMKNVTEKTEP